MLSALRTARNVTVLVTLTVVDFLLHRHRGDK